MKTRLVLTAVAFLALGAVWAQADTLEPEDQWITFDGTHWDHAHGVKMTDPLFDFDNGQVHRLWFRLTPLRGGVVFNDVTIESGDQVIYKHSDKNKLDIALHFYNTPAKHFEQRIFFAPPLEGFDKATGKVKFYFTAGADRYVITWTAADNKFAINIIKDN